MTITTRGLPAHWPLLEGDENGVPRGKLNGKVAIITGGDSGIGRSVAILFAQEGADICLVYGNEHKDADATMSRIEKCGRRVIRFSGDLADASFCEEVAQRTINAFGRINILVNNAGPKSDVPDEVPGAEARKPVQAERIFCMNIFGVFYLTKAVVSHLKARSVIINTTAAQACQTSPQMTKYVHTKAAVMNFTRLMASDLANREIRVHAIAHEPVGRPLPPAMFPAGIKPSFDENTAFTPAGRPAGVAPACVFFASEADSPFITGQVLHVNAGPETFRASNGI